MASGPHKGHSACLKTEHTNSDSSNLSKQEADERANLTLAQQIAARECKALEQLINSKAARVQLLIYRQINDYGDIRDAEELTADVFWQVWRDIRKFDPARGTFDTWINMLAWSTALDFRRKIRRRRPILDKFLKQLKIDSQPEQEVILPQILEDLLRQMSEEKRQLIDLRFFKGKTYDEIADLTGRPVGSVKSSLHRTLRELKQAVSKRAKPQTTKSSST